MGKSAIVAETTIASFREKIANFAATCSAAVIIVMVVVVVMIIAVIITVVVVMIIAVITVVVPIVPVTGLMTAAGLKPALGSL